MAKSRATTSRPRAVKPVATSVAAPVATPPTPREAIDQLDELELDLLMVLALAIEPLDPSAWGRLAREYGLGPERLGDAAMLALGQRQILAGLVTRQQSYNRIGFTLTGAIAMQVLDLVHARGRLVRFSKPDPLASAHLQRQIERRSPIAQLRIAVVLGDTQAALFAAARAYLRDRNELGRWVFDAIGPDPRPEWIASLPPDEVQPAYLSAVVRLESAKLRRVADAVIDHALAHPDKPLRLATARLLVLRGEAERARAIDKLPKWGAEGIELLAAFWSGDFAGALEIGENAYAGRKQRALPDLEGACHLLAAIVASATRPECIELVGQQLDGIGKQQIVELDVMEPVYDALRGGDPITHALASESKAQGDWRRGFLFLLHDVWLRPQARGHKDESDEATEAAATLASVWLERAEAGGYLAIARELAGMIAALAGKPTPGRLASAFKPPAAWEAALVSLEAALGPEVETAPSTRELIWAVELVGNTLAIEPRVRASARSKKGQVISLTRLLGGQVDDLLTDADRRVLACATTNTTRYTYGYGTTTLSPAAALALVGHPRVTRAEGSPCTIERGRATIRTRAEAGKTRVELVPKELRSRSLVFESPAFDRIVVYERSRELEQLAEILTRGEGLAIPEAGRERLARALARLSTRAAVELEGDLQVATQDLAADPRLVFQLGWTGAVLVVRGRVAPLGMKGPTLHPGAGASVLVADLRSSQGVGLARCTRDLAEEQRRCAEVLDACPTLNGFADGDLQWRVPSLHDALEVLLELDALGEQVVLAWHAGQKLGLPQRVGIEALRMKVGARKNWFDVEVTLGVDEHSVLHFRELLRMREGPRFVALPRGRFLALSEQLRRHLDRLESLGSEQGEGLRATPAVLPMLEELAAQTVDPSFDAGTLARLEQLREIASFVPRMPRGFATTLRDYQREGFTWMARLAEAGLGACLADDMGLGKTVQALALLAHRARKGPALVVCPTSVVINWINEASRFAPSLRFVELGSADDRAALIESAGPRSVIVASYALLALEVERLAKVGFASVVFDEAHALKNSTTQRAKAARQINAEFRLALTGTPIENHLGELWSLFAAILPGMLGSEAAFQKRFVGPREDRERSARLRALLRPFVLRRLKSQVLDELPPRTEITLRVEPYPEQLAFYEAMRRGAIERSAKLKPKQARFQLLAEITRLRQAAIDPRLIEPESAPPGAKLDVLMGRLIELREEGHRALVFTQFLGSLAAVRERLIAEGIEHFELEGSTPASERARRIDAFQAGEADVFLLSLRAGGTGVNLTGADYVFHLDPWWNPAVEDQASDRAHRIGQLRPVTIYRLVTEGTIEEKILALHGTKRQLADDLLAGLEHSDTLDLDQLRALLED